MDTAWMVVAGVVMLVLIVIAGVAHEHHSPGNTGLLKLRGPDEADSDGQIRPLAQMDPITGLASAPDLAGNDLAGEFQHGGLGVVGVVETENGLTRGYSAYTYNEAARNNRFLEAQVGILYDE